MRDDLTIGRFVGFLISDMSQTVLMDSNPDDHHKVLEKLAYPNVTQLGDFEIKNYRAKGPSGQNFPV